MHVRRADSGKCRHWSAYATNQINVDAFDCFVMGIASEHNLTMRNELSIGNTRRTEHASAQFNYSKQIL